MSIQFYNRYTKEVETETVYGESYLKWIYETTMGQLTLWAVVKRKLFSSWYGYRMNKPVSAEKIKPFIKDYELDASEFQKEAGEYTSFNDFFYRKLKPEARPLADADVCFPADGRHLLIPDLSKVEHVYAKGQQFDLEALLGCPKCAARFADGALVISRLCPVDYHRYHFPVSGKAGEVQLINGDLYSVSPYALRKNLSYFWQNKRVKTTVETESLGQVCILEVGATCVGSILQTYQVGDVSKGDEKGYFAFGGSCVMTFFENGKVGFSDDLVGQSASGIELYARVGDRLAVRK